MYQRCLFILLCGALALLPGCDKDENPPRIILQSPGNDALEGSRDSIAIQFNEPLDPASIQSDTITLMLDGQVVAGTTVPSTSLRDLIAFFPEKRLKLATTYQATLKKGISDTDGNRITSDMTWTFTVRDGAFGGGILVVAFDEDGGVIEPSFDAITPQVVYVPDEDDGLIVWAETDGGGNFNIRSKKFTDLDIKTISDSNNNNDAVTPRIAVSADDTAIAVWSQSDGMNSRIYANRLSSDSWNTALIIDGGTGAAVAPQVAMDANGNALVVWTESDSIYANRFTSGVGWGAAEVIDEDAGIPSAPQIAIDINGDAIAVWVEADRIYANRFSFATGWGTALPIDADTGTPTAPQIAIDPDGTDAFAVWSQSDGANINILANRYTGTWPGPDIIDLEQEVDGSVVTVLGTATAPQIAMDPAGNAIAIWSQIRDSRSRIYSNRFTASNSDWGTAGLIENFDDDTGETDVNSTEPQIVVDAAGNAFAAWTANNDELDNIVSNRYRISTGAWKQTLDILELDSPGNDGDANSPQLAVSSDYSVITVWSKATNPSDSNRTDIQLNLFD